MARIIHLTARLRAEYARQMRWRAKRSALIVEHMPLVSKIARSLRSKFPMQIPFDDLVQSGYVGLCEAAGRYEPVQGAFDRYCYRRVRGAIIDAHKRQAYREENHESFEAIQEARGFLPVEMQIDNRGPRPDELTLRREKMRVLVRRIERELPDDERDVLYEALRGFSLVESAESRGRSVCWARAKLLAARSKITTLPKAA